jgi:hypothetical protein
VKSRLASHIKGKNLKVTSPSSKQMFSGLNHVAKGGLASRKAFVFSSVILRFALDFCYWAFVSPNFAYMGFMWNPDPTKYIESWMLYIGFVIFAPKRLDRPSSLFLVILLFNVIAPLSSFYGLADKNRYHLYMVVLGYVLVSTLRLGRPFRLPRLSEGPIISKAVVLLGVMGVSAWFVLSGGLAFFNLDLTKVYDYRSNAGVEIGVRLMGYVSTWAYFVFGPALLTMALWKKAYFLALVVLTFHVFWFGVSSHRIVLFCPLLVIFTWVWFRRTRSLSFVPVVLSVVVVGCVLSFLLLDYILLPSIFVRRAFYTIANNTFDYYEFFTNNEFVWWSSSSVTFGLLDYPYDIVPAELIGEWRGTYGHVNNTFLSTGYMHAGIAGVVLYGVLVGLLFRVIDSLAFKGIPIWCGLGIMLIPVYSLIISSDLPTALLTKGIGVGMVVLFLMRGKQEAKAWAVRRSYRVVESKVGETTAS